MKSFSGLKILPIALFALALAALYVWLSDDAVVELSVRLPDAENGARVEGVEPAGPTRIQGQLVKFDGIASKLDGSWPRFRGANFDNVSNESVSLTETWPAEGPAVLWSIDVGEGYAGAAVLNGMVYIIDYDREKSADAIRCLSLDDGREIWRYFYPVKVKRNHGMSRTVPSVTDKYIVTLGPKCHVTCLDSVTGEFLWMLDLVRDFKTKVPPWYAGQCPLIEDGKAIIAPGGHALMIAVDCASGEILWQSPNPKGWKMTHSSVVPLEFAGQRMYVYCGSGGVAGISAEDGSILWETEQWKIRIANVPTPVIAGEGLIFLSGGYNAGCMMLQLTEKDGGIEAQQLFKLPPEEFGAPQHTPVYYKGYLYGVRQDGQLICLNTDGHVMWTSTSTRQFGLGPYVIANGLLYIMNDSGLLTLTRATPTGYIQLAEAKVLEGPDSWGAMAVAAGRLILRDLNRMICLDIGRQ